MQIRVRETSLYVTDCRARLPFTFGIATLTEAPMLTLRVEIECRNGERIEGFSSDLLVPKWFDKNPSTTVMEDRIALIDSVVTAARLSASLSEHHSVFNLWWTLRSELMRSSRPAKDESVGPVDPLVTGFGIAMLERAVIDAVCRLEACSFFAAAYGNLFGIAGAQIHHRLDAWTPSRSLPARPLRRMRVRHTIGLADAICSSDVATGDRIDDGLPESLEEDIRVFGLTCFKIKIDGDLDRSIDRLNRVAEVLIAAKTRHPLITIDGNEQWTSMSQLIDVFDALRGNDRGQFILAHLRSVEQPLHRTHTFDEDRNDRIDEVSRFAPVIIDEADATIDAFSRATRLGYRGVSVKNCKGVLRAIVSRGLCDLLNTECGETRFFQSAEDLTNLPVIALQEDLATVAALGLNHVERNGHHYFHGLDHLSESEASFAVKRHPDLYEQREASAFLRIVDGQVDIGSLQCSGFGYDVPTDVLSRMPVEEWLKQNA